MKRAHTIVLTVMLVLLANCTTGSATRPTAAGGAIKSETTTSSSTTTTTDMTGTTRIPPANVSEEQLPADCPSVEPLDGTDASARRSGLRMVSAQKGFAVDDTAVLVTDDGRTWSRRYSGADPMFSVDALDADHAWAVGQHVILATSDGGRSWQPAGEPAERMLRTVNFTDAQTGWGVTARHVVRTGDGGRTWWRVDPPCGGEAICFTGPDDGWAVTGRNVYRSTDGGDSWHPAFTAPADDITHPFNPESIQAGQVQCARPGVAWVTFTGSASGSHLAYAACGEHPPASGPRS